MSATITVGDRSVACDGDQSLLEAFLRAGVWMPSSCNQGTCGTCKLQVLDGEVDHRASPLDTLTEEERAAGLVLACQARPRGDARVALPGAGGTDRATHPLRDLAATVVALDDVARDTRRILLGLDEPLAFDAGQYVELVVPGSGERRQYSLANTAEEDKVLELHVRRVPGGVASDRWLLGDLAVVSLRGPDGRLAPVATAHAHRSDLARARLADPPRTLPADLARRYRAGRPFTMDGDTLVVPLVVAGRLLGAVDLVGTGGGARDRDDLALAEELGRRIAGAVDADRVAVREAQLQSVTAQLAAAGTLVEAAAALVDGVRAALAARTVGVYAGEPAAPLRLVRRAGPGLPDVAVRLDLDSPQAHAVRTAEPVWLPDGDALLARFPDAPDAGSGTDRALAALPLRTGDLVVGLLVAEFGSSREFPADERDFALALAGQAAQAFERAALADQRWRLAQTLQRVLLPPTLPGLDRIGLAARYLPAMREFQSGGDWYDVVVLDATRVAMAVGDVVGQGPAAAALMGQLRSVLATYLHDGLGPAAALEGLDRATRRIAGARGSTALCLVLDTATGELCWSAAGHLPPLLTGPEGARYAHGGEGTLLGLSGRPPYVEGREVVGPGTTIALYTDGLVERRGEVVDDGLGRLRSAAADLHALAPEPLAHALLARTLDGDETSDDVALVLARVLPAPLDLRSPAEGGQVRVLRQRLLRWSADAGLSEDATGDLVLVVSEIVTNCVEHAYRDAPGEIVCRVTLVAAGGVRVRVQDFGSWRPPPEDPGYRGRGLAIVHTLAEHVELDATSHGTTVTLHLAADTEPLAERPVADAAPQWWTRPVDGRRR
ncbi:MAG: SpoIIE family protein phosphatase [Pseudonocardiales bacterium]|nr:SpoIIE family protein phosphatase [Pseudonocardiales bacterium]